MSEELSRLNAYVVRSFAHSYDVLAGGVSKGQALARMAGLYNISAKEVLAIGNADNDVEMILWAGTGLAMKNSSEKLLAVADGVVLDGVAIALENYVLGESSCEER